MMNSKKMFFDKALAILDSLGCKYKIQSIWGEFGVLELEQPKPTRKKRRPNGLLDQIFKPVLGDMKIGDVVVVEFEQMQKIGDFASLPELAKSINKWLAYEHGTGSSTYSSNYKNKTVEVMRIR